MENRCKVKVANFFNNEKHEKPRNFLYGCCFDGWDYKRFKKWRNRPGCDFRLLSHARIIVVCREQGNILIISEELIYIEEVQGNIARIKSEWKVVEFDQFKMLPG